MKNQENFIDLILQHPLFCLLNHQDAQWLMGCSEPKHVEPGQVIVVEGEPIDCIYLVISGEAEVIREVRTLEKQQVLCIARLRAGEIIGLSSVGFTSHTGLRTATVIALSTMELFKITLYDFLQFLKKQQIKYPNLKKISEEFLLIQFIHSHHLFKNLTHEKIQILVKTARTITLSAGTYLYKEGDSADACYYLLKGEVILLNENKHSMGVKINQLIGDTEFMTRMKRRESAFVTSDCELLMIEMERAKKLIALESSSLLQKIISKIMKNQ